MWSHFEVPPSDTKSVGLSYSNHGLPSLNEIKPGFWVAGGRSLNGVLSTFDVNGHLGWVRSCNCN